jgi:S-methylmethionine-dependent homocysteine/selenocysteine methylase
MNVQATKFEKIFRESEIVLTEGALAVRLKSEYNITMDKHIAQAGIIYSYPHLLEKLYKQYIDIAVRHNLPIMLMTPTRKANFISVAESAYNSENVIADNCRFLNEKRVNIRDSPVKFFWAVIWVAGAMPIAVKIHPELKNRLNFTGYRRAFSNHRR